MMITSGLLGFFCDWHELYKIFTPIVFTQENLLENSWSRTIEVCHTLLQNSFVNIFSLEEIHLTDATVWCKINFSWWKLNWSNSLSLESDTFYSQVILHLVLLTFFLSCKSQKVTSCKLTERKAWPKLSDKFLYRLFFLRSIVHSWH